MRRLLDILLRVGRTDEERRALRGDLDETYATEIRPSGSWLGAQAWYAREIPRSADVEVGRDLEQARS